MLDPHGLKSTYETRMMRTFEQSIDLAQHIRFMYRAGSVMRIQDGSYVRHTAERAYTFYAVSVRVTVGVRMHLPTWQCFWPRARTDDA